VYLDLAGNSCGLDHGVGHFRPLSITRQRHLLAYHGIAMSEGVSKLLIWYPLLRTSATSFVGGTMMTQVLHCPYCHGTDIVRHGLSPEGKQRYRCRACLEGRGRTFLLEYSYAGHSPEVKQQIVDMAMNASGIRDTARVLHVSPTTVIKELKKKNLTSNR